MDSRTLIIIPKKTVTHSGLTRAYFTPCDWRMPLPKISDIMEDPDKHSSLLFHIGLNHKGLNWKIYHFQLSKDTFAIFMYALTYCMLHTNNSESYSWQIHKNARRVKKFIEKNDIPLTINEAEMLNIALNFGNWAETFSNKTVTLGAFIKGFKETYA